MLTLLDKLGDHLHLTLKALGELAWQITCIVCCFSLSAIVLAIAYAFVHTLIFRIATL